MQKSLVLLCLVCFLFTRTTGAPVVHHEGHDADEEKRHDKLDDHAFFMNNYPYCLPEGLPCERHGQHCCSKRCEPVNMPGFGFDSGSHTPGICA